MGSFLVPCNSHSIGVELRALILGSATSLSKITREDPKLFLYKVKNTRNKKNSFLTFRYSFKYVYILLYVQNTL